MSLDDAVILALEALRAVIEGEFDPEKVEMAVIPSKTKRFEKLSFEDLAKYIKRMGPKSSAKPAKE